MIDHVCDDTLRIGAGGPGDDRGLRCAMRGGGSCVDVVWPDTYLSHYVSLTCTGDPRAGSHSQRPGRGAVHHLMPRAVPRETSFGSSLWKLASKYRRHLPTGVATSELAIAKTHRIRHKAPPLVDMRASLARVQCWRFASGVAAAPITLFRTYLRSISTAPRRCVPPLWAKTALSPSVRSGRLIRDCPF